MKTLILSLYVILSDGTNQVCYYTEVNLAFSNKTLKVQFDGVEYNLDIKKRIGEKTNDEFSDSFVNSSDNRWIMESDGKEFYVNGGIKDKSAHLFITNKDEAILISTHDVCIK